MKRAGLLLIALVFLAPYVFMFACRWEYPIKRNQCNHINTECIKGTRYVIVDNRKIRLKKFDKNALNQVSDIYCYD